MRSGPDSPMRSRASFGSALLGEDGWDPYLESSASLWLLHWKLLEAPCIAPSWYFALAQPGAVAASGDAVLSLIQRSCADRPEWGEVATNSLRKDVRCLLRMYASVMSGRDLLEDTIDSPFSELGLLRELPGTPKTLVFVEGPKPGLADDVVAYASVRFAMRQSEGVTPLSRLASETGSPGVVFRLSESQLAAAIERASKRYKGIRCHHQRRRPGVCLFSRARRRPRSHPEAFLRAKRNAGRSGMSKLADYIAVSRPDLRSVSLERDLGTDDPLKSYSPPIAALQLLGAINRSCASGARLRAWSVIGPYGAGKSTFAHLLAGVLGPKDDDAYASALRAIRSSDRGLANALTRTRRKAGVGRRGRRSCVCNCAR